MATVLVTGANRGIGLEYCRQLSVRGDHVIAVCRKASRELGSLGVQIEAGIELTEASALDELMSRLQSQCLDGVILNAGILHSNALNNLDVEAIRQQFEINALAPLRLVSALTSNLSFHPPAWWVHHPPRPTAGSTYECTIRMLLIGW